MAIQRFAWSVVKQSFLKLHIGWHNCSKTRTFGEALPHQPVGVLIETALSAMICVAKHRTLQPVFAYFP